MSVKNNKTVRSPDAKKENLWLALAIGNSRLHWALFDGGKLQSSWDTEYIQEISNLRFPIANSIDLQFPLACQPASPTALPLYLASVVPSQTVLWQNYPNLRVITLADLPLGGVYPSLGIDRALAVVGAGETFGWPILVIDAGTALTFTGADASRKLVGGAILPGLRLQVNSLAKGTGALPSIELPATLPPRWALDTSSAIQSGILYTVLAGIVNFIEAWRQEFPESSVVLTGGDRDLLLNYLQIIYPKIGDKIAIDPNLIFWGMRSIYFRF